VNQKVVIVGGGIGGLATACILGQAGYEVTLYEKNAHPGGKASLLKAEGFSFDMGPSWCLMPDIYEHFFELLGEDMNRLLKLTKLAPSYRVFFKDTLLGSTDIYSDIKKDGPTFESLEPGANTSLISYLEHSRQQYEVAKAKFLYKNYDSWRDFLTLEMISEAFRVKIFSSIEKHVSQYFRSNEVQKIMLYTTTFLGARPSETPALYNVMNHVDLEQGVFYPEGGMYSVVQTLVDLAEKRGVTIVCNQEVEKIVTNNSKACGIKVNGKTIEADIIIANADIPYVEQQLLGSRERMYSDSYWKRRTLAPSALALYIGVKGTYPELQHHNLVFSRDWDKHFDTIFKKKRWPKDPSFYVCNPSKTDKSVAPKDHENLFVLVPIAPGLKYTEQLLEDFTDQILTTMEQTLHLKELKNNITYKKIFCVKDFEQQYNAWQGSALGLAHTLKQTAVFRPKNVHKKIKNLYFVGANTVPGIGIPMCLISAELVYKRIVGDTSSGPLERV
jgi:phytoene desaturase